MLNDCSVRVILEVETGFEPVYTALQAVASPLGHSTDVRPRPESRDPSERTTGFEPVWTALQAAASPLGHATKGETLHSSG